MRTAAVKSAKVLDRWRKDLPNVDQDDATLTYASFETKLEKDIADEANDVECAAAVVQSGSSGYNTGIGVRIPEKRNSRLSFDTIVVSAGTRAHQYCSFVSRTLLIAPTNKQEVRDFYFSPQSTRLG